MNILPQRSLFLPVCGIFLGSIFLALLAPRLVQADVGPRPVLPGGSSIKPEDETPIQMMAERVVMNVRLATEADNMVIKLDPESYGFQLNSVWFQVIADVQADFTMKNPTSESVSMITWFPLASALEAYSWEEFSPEELVPRIQSFTVSVDGIPVETTVSELPNPKGADKPLLPWASFPATFPAGKDTNIHVSYVLPLHQLVSGNALALYYIFQTGAGWAGPIGQVELILNLPYPASPETLSGMPSGSLNPPYFVYFGDEITSIPASSVLEGNQARWTWKDLEPGPQDDFSILLLQPGRWNTLQTARAAVKTKPDDGQAWVELCATYHTLSSRGAGQIPTGWAEIYQSLGIQACQEAARFLPTTTPEDGQVWLKLCATYHLLSAGEISSPSLAIQACQEAARLLPGDAAPHFGLAVLYLSALPHNPSAEELQPVLDELKFGQELEAVKPPSDVIFYDYRVDVSPSEYIIDRVNKIFNDATATAEWSVWSTDWANKTAAAVLETPAMTSTPKPVRTPQPIPSATPPPMPATPATPIETPGGEQSQVLIVAVGLIGLLIVGSLALVRFRSRASK